MNELRLSKWANRNKLVGLQNNRTHKRRWLNLLLVSLVCCGSDLDAQTDANCVVQTIVGSPVTSSGDGGPAVSALFLGPLALASDSAGDFYIADQGNNRVRMITPDGTISTVAGLGQRGFSGDEGPAALALLNQPASVALAPDGTLFIADTYNNRIRRVTADGTIETIAGTGDAGFSGDEGLASAAQLYLPTALAHDGVNLYIADQGNYRVRMIDPSGIIHTYAGTGHSGQCIQPILPDDGMPATQTPLCSVTALAVDSQHRLYVGQGGCVFRILSDGTVQYVVGLRNLGAGLNPGVGTDGESALSVDPGVTALAIAPDDTLYFSGLNLKTPENGSLFTIWTVGSSGLLQHLGSMRASSMTFSPAGLLVAWGDQTFLIDSQGDATLYAGQGFRGFSGDGGPGTLAKLSSPGGLAIDSNSDVYISDTSNGRVRKFSPDGTIATIAGTGSVESSGNGGSAVAAGVPAPTKLSVDPAGNLYILENGGPVREVDTSGTITTYAGDGKAGPSSASNDGQPANSFTLTPVAMTIGNDGTLFLGDFYGNIIWTVTPDDIAHVLVNRGITGPFGQFAVDSQGNLLWDSYWDRSFVQISPTGARQLIPGLTQYLHGAAALAFDSQGALYGSSNQFGGEILRVGTDGNATVVVGAPFGSGGYGDGPASSSLAGSISAIAFDASGNLYFSDTLTARVRVLAAGCLSQPASESTNLSN